MSWRKWTVIGFAGTLALVAGLVVYGIATQPGVGSSATSAGGPTATATTAPAAVADANTITHLASVMSDKCPGPTASAALALHAGAAPIDINVGLPCLPYIEITSGDSINLIGNGSSFTEHRGWQEDRGKIEVESVSSDVGANVWYMLCPRNTVAVRKRQCFAPTITKVASN